MFLTTILNPQDGESPFYPISWRDREKASFLMKGQLLNKLPCFSVSNSQGNEKEKSPEQLQEILLSKQAHLCSEGQSPSMRLNSTLNALHPCLTVSCPPLLPPQESRPQDKHLLGSFFPTLPFQTRLPWSPGTGELKQNGVAALALK